MSPIFEPFVFPLPLLTHCFDRCNSASWGLPHCIEQLIIQTMSATIESKLAAVRSEISLRRQRNDTLQRQLMDANNERRAFQEQICQLQQLLIDFEELSAEANGNCVGVPGTVFRAPLEVAIEERAVVATALAKAQKRRLQSEVLLSDLIAKHKEATVEETKLKGQLRSAVKKSIDGGREIRRAENELRVTLDEKKSIEEELCRIERRSATLATKAQRFHQEIESLVGTRKKFKDEALASSTEEECLEQQLSLLRAKNKRLIDIVYTNSNALKRGSTSCEGNKQNQGERRADYAAYSTDESSPTDGKSEELMQTFDATIRRITSEWKE